MNWMVECLGFQSSGPHATSRLVTGVVLRGSIPGHGLFDFFINDMEEVMNCTFIKFVDDYRPHSICSRRGLPFRGV